MVSELERYISERSWRNLERITKQNMHMRIKENSIPHCRASPLARVHMKNFHLN